MKFTIIGCGNAGLIHAAKILEAGNAEVALLKTSNVHDDFFNVIQQEGGYNVKDETNGGNRFFVHPTLITRDVEKAVKFADVLMVMTTTLQHEAIAKLIAPYVRDGQMIILVPGYMGSLIFKKYINKDVLYSEWETTAYNGRIVDSMYVRITFYNPRNAVSALPANRAQEVVDVMSKYFPNTKYTRKHILESALHNPNMIVHTIGMTLSAARIEHSKGEFWMYKEAFTDSVVKVINKFDEEKNEILKAFGCEPLNYFDAAKWRNEESEAIDAMQSFRNFAEESNKGPMQLRHRYLLEDVPNGLGLFISLGKLTGVKTTIADSICTLASALLGENFSERARTIQSLMGENVTLEDTIKQLQ